MEDQIQIEDQSGDRNYFTMIPNYILNHSGSTTQALYMQLKRLAGEKGLAYPGRRYLCKQLDISPHTLTKSLNYLLKKQWIQYTGDIKVQTDGGVQKVKAYKITDLWKLNTEFYQKTRGGKIEPPTTKGGQNMTPLINKGGATRGGKIEPKEELIKEEQRTNNVKTVKTVYDLFIKEFSKNEKMYKLTKNRKAKITTRLKDSGYELLEMAIKNTAASEFHRGDNNRGWEADLDFIIRSEEQVERLANLSTKKNSETRELSREEFLALKAKEGGGR